MWLYGVERGHDFWGLLCVSPRWTWVWASFGSWWWTGKPGMLQSMGLKRVGHNWVTELNWTVCETWINLLSNEDLLLSMDEEAESSRPETNLGLLIKDVLSFLCIFQMVHTHCSSGQVYLFDTWTNLTLHGKIYLKTNALEHKGPWLAQKMELQAHVSSTVSLICAIISIYR